MTSSRYRQGFCVLKMNSKNYFLSFWQNLFIASSPLYRTKSGESRSHEKVAFEVKTDLAKNEPLLRLSILQVIGPIF